MCPSFDASYSLAFQLTHTLFLDVFDAALEALEKLRVFSLGLVDWKLLQARYARPDDTISSKSNYVAQLKAYHF